MFCSDETSSLKSPLAEIILVNVVEIYDLLLYYGGRHIRNRLQQTAGTLR